MLRSSPTMSLALHDIIASWILQGFHSLIMGKLTRLAVHFKRFVTLTERWLLLLVESEWPENTATSRKFSYILAPQNVKPGDSIQNGGGAAIKAGNSLPLTDIPLGTVIHNVELLPGRGGQIARSAGTSCTLVSRGALCILYRNNMPIFFSSLLHACNEKLTLCLIISVLLRTYRSNSAMPRIYWAHSVTADKQEVLLDVQMKERKHMR